MEKTTEKMRKLSEVITDLQGWMEKEGDVEVVIVNEAEACFDGFGSTFMVYAAKSNEKFLGIIRSNLVIKPS